LGRCGPSSIRDKNWFGGREAGREPASVEQWPQDAGEPAASSEEFVRDVSMAPTAMAGLTECGGLASQ